MIFIFRVVCFLSLFLINKLSGQRVIAVQNPTFEKNQLWHSCIFDVRSSKDLSDDHSRNNHNIVTQADGTFEGISQQLVSSVHKGVCYRLTFYARRDSAYIEKLMSPTSDQEWNTNPLNLYVYGADGNCGFGELIAAPVIIRSHQWTKYEITIQSKQDWSHLNVYAMRSDQIPYHGYVLFHQQGSLIPEYCPNAVAISTSASFQDLNSKQAYSVLTFGGILMLYEVGPKSINLFDRKGEIIQSVLLRKDESRNYGLDSVLNNTVVSTTYF